MSDPVQIKTPRFTIEGVSRAGIETWFRIKEFGVLLDIGRCPDPLVGTPNLFISHAHIDHSLGLPFWAAQRKLQGLEPGIVYVPHETLEDYRELIRIHERLQNGVYRLTFVGLGAGDRVDLRRDLFVKVHRAEHRVVTNAYEFVDKRRKLRPEFVDLRGEEIARRKVEGEELFDETELSMLLYTGDTGPEIFDRVDALFKTEVLIIECTFTSSEDQDRARKYTHIHLDDLVAVADRFENELVVLSHLSRRDAPDDIRREVDRRLPKTLSSRVRLLL